MAKDPAFLFYSADFYLGTVDMTDAQVGQYIRLLCLQHQKGHLSEAMMASGMGGKFDEMIACKFLVDENRCYYNERLDEEVIRRTTYTESRRKNLRTTPTHMDKHMLQHMDTHMQPHMETETEADTDTITTKITKRKISKKPLLPEGITDRFTALWDIYPRKQGRAAALKSYERAVKAGAKDDDIKRGIEAYIAYIQGMEIEPQYIKNGSTFFKQQAWEDDYTVKKTTGKTVSAQRYEQREYTEEELNRGLKDILEKARQMEEA